jgi:protein-tyrosine phosphatase
MYQITERLFIRGMFNNRPNKLEELREAGVDVVVCMLRLTDPDMLDLPDIEYKQFPLPDSRTVDEKTAFAAARFVVERYEAGHSVLVHCIGAHSRSPFVAALALTAILDISGAEALERVRAARPNAVKNPAFERYLREDSS